MIASSSSCERKVHAGLRILDLADLRAGDFGIKAVHGVGRPQQHHLLPVVDVGVDEDLDGFVGAVGEDELLRADAGSNRRCALRLGRTRGRRRVRPALDAGPSGASITCGEHPTVFSLKSRRSLSARPPVGGEYGAIEMTAGRGLDRAFGQLRSFHWRPDLHRARVRFQPSARASVVMAGASSASAFGVSSCTEITLT